MVIWVWIHWMEIEDVGIEETFSRLEKWGVSGVKTDFLERQDQEIVNWCERVCRVAARHRIMVNFHGSFKSTGLERTWPNMITREAVLGNEMSIFRKTVTPAHCATLPFTRFLLGPADFTPGGFGNVYSKAGGMEEPEIEDDAGTVVQSAKLIVSANVTITFIAE